MTEIDIKPWAIATDAHGFMFPIKEKIQQVCARDLLVLVILLALSERDGLGGRGERLRQPIEHGDDPSHCPLRTRGQDLIADRLALG